MPPRCCLLQDREGLLWMGTQDGLNLWDERNRRLYQLHISDGLVNNSIKALVEDSDHSPGAAMCAPTGKPFASRSRPA
ncbi:two-component regulator propeller domain-containing protein [Paraflavisolibacter sp. H34]|uniref:two-component regulator propeller domain-containing protein n=1 Tax=Huijunlia imazamoxiresistens TaxID=3127457 RepID=UPI0039C94DB9